MIRLALLTGMLLMSVVANGQATASYLGQTRAPMLAALGKPDGVSASLTSSKVYGPSAHSRVLASSGIVVDSYIKRYSGIEFGIDVLYMLDVSNSRLHPAERVGSVTYTPDKNYPFLVLLNSLPVTKQLCRGGCVMMLSVTSGVSYEAFVYPKVVSSAQRQLAGQLATGFNQYLPVETSYIPAIDIFFQSTPGSAEDASFAVFSRLTVDRLRLDVSDMDFERKQAGLFKEIEFPVSK